MAYDVDILNAFSSTNCVKVLGRKMRIWTLCFLVLLWQQWWTVMVKN